MAALSKDQLIAQARAQVREFSPEEAHNRCDADPPAILIDIRESDEVATGQVEVAHHIPRGFLELRIEGVAPDRSHELIVYCAGGTRSLLAARSLQEMGYEKVRSMASGFNGWKSRGLPWVTPKQLNPDQKIRYARHLLLSQVGEVGQRKLLDAKVLLVGAGGLGSPTALYLGAAGVGHLGVVDPDVVDISNLQRQIMHRSADAGVPKVDSAERALLALNPDVQVTKYEQHLNASNVMQVLDDGWQIVVDGCDNFPTRYLVNDACVFRGLPNVHGSIFQFEGQASVFAPGLGGPCYRCLYPEPPPPGMAPSCAEAGVIGALPGLIGTVQATETLKLILGIGEPLIGRLMQLDALDMKWRELKFRRDPGCPVCGDQPTVTELIDYEAFCGL